MFEFLLALNPASQAIAIFFLGVIAVVVVKGISWTCDHLPAIRMAT